MLSKVAKSHFLPNEHLEGKAEVLHFTILAHDGLERLLNVAAIRIVLLVDHQDTKHLFIHFSAHLLCYVLLLFFHSLLHRLNHQWLGLVVCH